MQLEFVKARHIFPYSRVKSCLQAELFLLPKTVTTQILQEAGSALTRLSTSYPRWSVRIASCSCVCLSVCIYFIHSIFDCCHNQKRQSDKQKGKKSRRRIDSFLLLLLQLRTFRKHPSGNPIRNKSKSKQEHHPAPAPAASVAFRRRRRSLLLFRRKTTNPQ